jgi:hypothetical protein
MRFPDAVAAELERARAKHPARQSSLHEGYAVLLEEVDELWEQVKKRASERDWPNILLELVQIAAMAQRTAEDVAYRQHADQS